MPLVFRKHPCGARHNKARGFATRTALPRIDNRRVRYQSTTRLTAHARFMSQKLGAPAIRMHHITAELRFIAGGPRRSAAKLRAEAEGSGVMGGANQNPLLQHPILHSGLLLCGMNIVKHLQAPPAFKNSVIAADGRCSRDHGAPRPASARLPVKRLSRLSTTALQENARLLPAPTSIRLLR